jgi:integrase
MRYRERFSLYLRNGVYYYRCYDEAGRRCVGRSTGQAVETLAREHCLALDREGKLIPTRDVLFESFADSWWIWDKCSYLRGRLARSAPGRPAVSRRYADQMRSILQQHLIPGFGKYKLSAITAAMIEEWSLGLRENGLSGKHVNDILSGLRIMFTEALRQGRIRRNPFEAVRPLGVDRKERGVLSVEEVREMFLDTNIKKIWNEHTLHRTLNLAGASTGCRMGELLALRDEDVHEGWLHIAHSWHPRYGLGPTKTRQTRDVPVPGRTLEAIQRFTGTGGFIFSLDRGSRPIGHTAVAEGLYRALDQMGIDEQERVRRRLSFHSWRHWTNSVLRARGVPDPLVKRLTGHGTQAMTEHYSTFLLRDYAPVLAVQEEVLG